MQEQVKLPDMGEGVESATVTSILVQPGDDIEVDQGIIELETDKAVAEVPSPKAGTVKEIHVEPGQEVEPGTPLLTLEVGEGEDGGGADQPDETQEAEQPQKDAAGEKEREKEEAETAEKDEKKAGEADQAQKETEAEGASAGKPGGADRAQEVPHAARRQRQATAGDGAIPAAPYVRRLARELGVDLSKLSGSGEGGWITEADVKAAVRGGSPRRPAPKAEGEEGDRDDWGPVRREKMPKIRRTIADKMAESHANTVRVTHFADADVTDLEDFRARHKQDFADEEIKLSLLPFIVRAVVDALKLHPVVNASLDADAGQIIYKQYVSIGLAVDSDRGLVVPVLREAGSLSLAETARQIDRLAGKVRSGEFEVADLRGGTFTVSNLGSVGGKYATPVINYPESALLLTGRAKPTPVVREDRVVIRTMLPLSLSYDHRIIDGAEAGRFLNDVISLLEDPGRLLMS